MKKLAREVLRNSGPLYKIAGDAYHSSLRLYERMALPASYPGVRIFDFNPAKMAELRQAGYQSQYGQEFILLDNGLIKQSGGFFVEFGANNPTSNSNTWYLEKKLGYRGLSVDPLPLEDVWGPERPRTRFVKAFITQETGQEVRLRRWRVAQAGNTSYPVGPTQSSSPARRSILRSRKFRECPREIS